MEADDAINLIDAVGSGGVAEATRAVELLRASLPIEAAIQLALLLRLSGQLDRIERSLELFRLRGARC